MRFAFRTATRSRKVTFPLRSQRGLVSIPSGSARTRRHDKTYIDGFNFMPFFKGDVAKGPRQSIFFFDDTGKLNAVRVGDWKIHFAFSDHWYGGGPAKPQNFPQVVNLREDPFEAHIDDEHSPMYFRWAADKLWTVVPAQAAVGQWLATFKEFPTSQKSASFNIDQVLEQLQEPGNATGN